MGAWQMQGGDTHRRNRRWPSDVLSAGSGLGELLIILPLSRHIPPRRPRTVDTIEMEIRQKNVWTMYATEPQPPIWYGVQIRSE